jgi:hypothetical protein
MPTAINNRLAVGITSPLLSYEGQKLSIFTATVDRDQTASRRSKPSSRTTLDGEQPYPWNPLQLQDVMSRHRGAKRSRQYELSRIISLLSLTYLLSVKRWPFHTAPSDHYDRLPSLIDVSISQSSELKPLHLPIQREVELCSPLCISVTFWETATPAKLPLKQCSISSLEMIRLQRGIS